MKITCECGKMLHAGECAFHNENYEDFFLFVCPYCAQIIPCLMPLRLEDAPSVREIKPEIVVNPSKESEAGYRERLNSVNEKMIQLNDGAVRGLEGLKAWAEEEGLTGSPKDIDRIKH